MRDAKRVALVMFALAAFSSLAWADDKATCMYVSDPKLLISSCSSAIEELSKSNDKQSGEELAAVYGRRAEGHLLLGNFKVATSDLKKAIELQPDTSSLVGNRLMYLRAVANLLQGQADEAIADCNVLLNLAPNADVYWVRANAYYNKDDMERSANDLAEARKLAVIHPLDGDPKEGEWLAAKLCSSCHDTGEPSNTKKKYKAPSFKTIAGRPSQSADQIVADIIYPHPGMPRLRFESFYDAMQLSSLAAYVMTLKRSSE